MKEFWQALRANNIRRDAKWDPMHLVDEDFRLFEFIGEFGELCNCIKKQMRERIGLPGSRVTKQDIAEEFADAAITIDLLSMQHNPSFILGDDLTVDYDKFYTMEPSKLIREMIFAAGFISLNNHSIWADEFATMLGILAIKFDIDLKRAVENKFNKTSEKIGLPIWQTN